MIWIKALVFALALFCTYKEVGTIVVHCATGKSMRKAKYQALAAIVLWAIYIHVSW